MISYHSPYPDSNSALIVRATDGRMSIEWEIEPVVTSLKPTADGRGRIIRIFNVAKQSETLRLSGPLAEREGIYLSNLPEDRVKRASGPVEVPGFDIVTLRVER